MSADSGAYVMGTRVALVFAEDGDVDFADGCLGTVAGPPDEAGWTPVIVDCDLNDRYWFGPDELRLALPEDLPCAPRDEPEAQR